MDETAFSYFIFIFYFLKKGKEKKSWDHNHFEGGQYNVPVSYV